MKHLNLELLVEGYMLDLVHVELDIQQKPV
jgi:hypothetical protein